eukprot:2352346-Amphidinium_carterae.1
MPTERASPCASLGVAFDSLTPVKAPLMASPARSVTAPSVSRSVRTLETSRSNRASVQELVSRFRCEASAIVRSFLELEMGSSPKHEPARGTSWPMACDDIPSISLCRSGPSQPRREEAATVQDRCYVSGATSLPVAASSSLQGFGPSLHAHDGFRDESRSVNSGQI